MGEAEATKRLQQVLETVFISDIIEGQKLLSLKASDSVAAAANLLIENDISSAPVFPDSGSLKADDCLGVVDFVGIATVLINLKSKGFADHDPRKNIWAKVANLSCTEAIEFNESQFVRVKSTDPVREAVEKCAQFAFRRMLAVDKDGNVAGLVSPSQCVTHVMNAVGAAPEFTLQRTVEKLSVGNGPVIHVRTTAHVEEAFKLMVDQVVTTVAIVDPDSGKMVASISASDIGLMIKEESSSFLGKSVWAYFTHKKDKEVDERFPFFSVSPKSTLKRAIEKLQATSVHHVYVVDEGGIPLKIIGLSDICQGLLTCITHKSVKVN